jgi:DNA polymerase III epsilon subunit-like protein
MSLLPVILDTETTGTDINKESIVQFAALIVDSSTGERIPMMNTLCNPGRRIGAEAAEVHGISDEAVAFAMPAEWVLQHFKNLLDKLEAGGNDIILCGANHTRFDIPLMHNLLPTAGFKDYLTVDSYTMFLRDYPDMPHKLGELYEWYCEGDASKAHDAMADCEMVADILIKYVLDNGKGLLEIAREQEQPRVLDKFPLGKHKGLPVNDVPHSYMRWCRANFTEVHPDVEATICSVLNCEEWTDKS